jgi:ABC-type Na+ efflux pump permease subunit
MISVVRGVRGAGKLSRRRVWAITRKELREYRRNRSVLVAMSILPLVFLIQPIVAIFVAPAAAAGQLRHGNELLYLLGVPALVPASLAAYAITGERQQGSLEPVLTTPITREELIVGKALAALMPSVLIAYAVYVVFLVLVGLFAQTAVASAIFEGPDVVVQVIYTPLVAALAVWIGLAVSTRANDVRVAQQLSLLASLPMMIGAAALAYDVIHVDTKLFVIIGAVLAVADIQAWRIVAPMFDRERLIAGARS